jgi:ribosomal protein S18 acetylase RimI-like enzyme
LIIRPYTHTDWSRLCAIHDAARLDELRLSAGEAAFLTLEETAVNEGLFAARLDVAEIDDVVVGFVAYSADELTWLYVDPMRYRQGIGRALLGHALTAAGPTMRLEILEGNEAALRLYLDEGFQIAQRVEGRLEGNEKFAAVGYVLEYRREG